jgi:hypothetical protein
MPALLSEVAAIENGRYGEASTNVANSGASCGSKIIFSIVPSERARSGLAAIVLGQFRDPD